MSREWERAYHWFSREAVPAFNLSPAQISVYNALRDRANDDGETFPSQDTIGRESGLGPRAVRAAVARLVEVGLVEIIRRGRRSGIRYRIGMRPALLETGSRIRNDGLDTGSRIRFIPDRGSDEEDPVKKTHLLGAPPLVAGDDEMLQDFMRIYPGPCDLAKVRDAWAETGPHRPAEILGYVRAHAEAMRGRDPHFIPRPENWLRRHGWEKVKPIPVGGSARYQQWIDSPEGQAHMARKEPISE